MRKQYIQFEKLHGLGNDFILIDAISQRIDRSRFNEIGQKLSSRNFGIGADGVIFCETSSHNDLKMTVVNQDGSEPEMCGNGLRCFAKFAYDKGLVNQNVFSVETGAGTRLPAIIETANKIAQIEVNMGKPIFERTQIPMLGTPQTQVIDDTLTIDEISYTFSAVSMGNPHCVIFVDDLTQIDISDIGPKIENHPLFPNKTNVEFVQVLSKTEAVMVVWERGAGETLACGTGACAVAVLGQTKGLLNESVIIHLPGGDLKIDWINGKEVIMTGPAETVYTGTICLE